MATHVPAESLGSRELAPASQAQARASRATWAALGITWCAAVLVFWGFDALPFMDLPAHAGLIALRHRFASSPFEQQHFVLAENLGPYSLFRFLGEIFHRLFGPIGAVRALATLPLLVTPFALWLARKRLHGDASPMALFFGIALSFGLMTMLGFASYLLGLALLLIVLTLWLELLAEADDGRPTTRKEIGLAIGAAFLFVAHGHAFVLGLGLMAITTVYPLRSSWQRRVVRLRALVPAIAIAAYAAMLSRQGRVPEGSVALAAAALDPVFQNPLDKLGLLVTSTLTTRTGLDVLAACLIWAVLGGAAYRSARGTGTEAATDADRRTKTFSRSLLACAAAVGTFFVALPHSIGWFGFVDGRLVPLVLFLLLMAIDRKTLGSLGVVLDRSAILVAALLVTLALAASVRFQDEARGYREVLARVPAQARLLNLPIDPNSDVFTGHPFVHYDKLILAERPIVVSDVWFHQGTALFPTAQNPALRLPRTYSESNLVRVDWPAYRLADWDYVLIRTRPEGGPGPLPDALELVIHEGGWRLFRVNGSRSEPSKLPGH